MHGLNAAELEANVQAGRGGSHISRHRLPTCEGNRTIVRQSEICQKVSCMPGYRVSSPHCYVFSSEATERHVQDAGEQKSKKRPGRSLCFGAGFFGSRVVHHLKGSCNLDKTCHEDVELHFGCPCAHGQGALTRLRSLVCHSVMRPGFEFRACAALALRHFRRHHVGPQCTLEIDSKPVEVDIGIRQ